MPATSPCASRERRLDALLRLLRAERHTAASAAAFLRCHAPRPNAAQVEAAAFSRVEALFASRLLALRCASRGASSGVGAVTTAFRSAERAATRRGASPTDGRYSFLTIGETSAVERELLRWGAASARPAAVSGVLEDVAALSSRLGSGAARRSAEDAACVESALDQLARREAAAAASARDGCRAAMARLGRECAAQREREGHEVLKQREALRGAEDAAAEETAAQHQRHMRSPLHREVHRLAEDVLAPCLREFEAAVAERRRGFQRAQRGKRAEARTPIGNIDSAAVRCYVRQRQWRRSCVALDSEERELLLVWDREEKAFRLLDIAPDISRDVRVEEGNPAVFSLQLANDAVVKLKVAEAPDWDD